MTFKYDFSTLDAQIDWEKMNNQIPVIIQHIDHGDVLMLGYMNPEALEKTLTSGLVTFYSRSKDRLWTKGETSGDYLHLRDVTVDCDGDTLLAYVKPSGAVCHLGTSSCFKDDNQSVYALIDKLETTIHARNQNRPANSYLTRLFEKGSDKIAQKVGEEGVESVIAAIQADQNELSNEVADLFFHILVMLYQHDLSFADILAVLKKRQHG